MYCAFPGDSCELFISGELITGILDENCDCVSNNSSIGTVNKIVDYFNNNPLFTELRERNFQRISSIIFDNEQTIKQIDKLLAHYTSENKTKTTQLYIDNKDVRPNELIKTKISLQNENQELKKENLTTKAVSYTHLTLPTKRIV